MEAEMAEIVTDRVFGEHEAIAMFEAIDNALALVGSKHCGTFLAELRAERARLLDCRAALVHLLAAAKTENFNRPARAREMSNALRSGISRAERALSNA
jgi:hypothetical protein